MWLPGAGGRGNREHLLPGYRISFVDEENVLRTLAIFKIANPKSILRFCGGRMRLSDDNQKLALQTCVEGIMIGNYLTTIGKNPKEDIETVRQLGKTISS